jgi:hypothetical protein
MPAYISGMKNYRLDPKNPPQLTPEEARRLDETPIDYSDIPPLGDEFFTKAQRRAMRYLLCRSCGALHLGTPAATTDLCANCGGSKFRLASIEMVTQPIPSVRWPRPFSAEDREMIEAAWRTAADRRNRS